MIVEMHTRDGAPPPAMTTAYERGAADERERLRGILKDLLDAARQDLAAASGVRQRRHAEGAVALAEALLARFGGAVAVVAPPTQTLTQRKMAPFIDQLGTRKDGEIAREAGVSPPTVRKYREARGIALYRKKPPTYIPSPKRPPPAWQAGIRDRLGTVSDTVLAREAGVSRERVRQYRSSLGVTLNDEALHAVRAEAGATKRRPLPDEARAWFGVVSDAEIARRLRCGTSVVAKWRKRYGLPASPEPTPTRTSRFDAFRDRFGVDTDKDIAKAAGLTMGAIISYRRTHPDLPRSPRAQKRRAKAAAE